MGCAVSIHDGTRDFNDLEDMIRRTTEKAAQAYIDFPDIPLRQLVDGSLQANDVESWRRCQEHVEEIKRGMGRLKNSNELDIKIE